MLLNSFLKCVIVTVLYMVTAEGHVQASRLEVLRKYI